jgi:outer membrane protein OmpA-like peptidoglycan-associated protein
MTRWLVAIIAAAVLVAVGVGAFYWRTSNRATTAHAPAAQSSAPAPAPVARTDPPSPAPAPAAQSSAPSSAASPVAPTPAPASVAQSSAPAPTPAQTSPPASAPAPVAPAAATADQATGANAKAAGEAASLKPGSGAKDLTAALSRTVITFVSARAEVPPSMADDLKRVAEDMKQLPPGHRLQITGYTDSSGNPAKNVTLSQNRAEAVRNELIKDGVNPDMLVAKGYGSADPIASNDTPEGRSRNRRIEFHIVKTP